MHEAKVADHYGSEGLVERLLTTLEAAGHTVEPLDPDVLAGADEFHFGGRGMTDVVLSSLEGVVGPILDVGSGIGGPVRVMARRLEGPVTGLDLTPEFVAASVDLTDRTGIEASFQVGSALDMPFEDDSFAAAVMFHVGMNIEDKATLCSEVARVLRPGGRFVIYDLMRVGEGELQYPMPWAMDETTSFVESPAAYEVALRSAGFVSVEGIDRTEDALSAIQGQQGPPPVFLDKIMGEGIREMVGHIGAAIHTGTLAPFQINAFGA